MHRLLMGVATICDVCRLSHLILSILKPVFHQIQLVSYAYNLLWLLNPLGMCEEG